MVKYPRGGNDSLLDEVVLDFIDATDTTESVSYEVHRDIGMLARERLGGFSDFWNEISFVHTFCPIML